MNFKQIILTLSLLGTLLLYTISVKNSNEIKLLNNEDGFYFIVTYENETATIYPWYDETTGIWELFLPSYLNDDGIVNIIIEADEIRFLDLQTHNNKIALNSKVIYKIDGLEQEAIKFRINLSENISSIFIETESKTMQNVDEDKDYKERGTISSVNKDGIVEYFGELESISGHGNGTWLQEKKPYNLKMASYGALAGLSPAKDWILLAMHYEGDKIHSKVAYEIERILGGKYPSECTWVDVYLNGKYNGLYLLINSVKGRFNFERDGFLVEKEMESRLDGEVVSTYSGENFVIKKYAGNLENLVAHMQNCEDTIYSETSKQDKIDIESFAIQFMVDKIALNNDSFKTSSYIYKLDGDNKVYAGPSWDYDGAFAEYLHHGKDWVNPKGSIFVGEERLAWYGALYNTPKFRTLIGEKLLTHSEEIKYLVNEKISEYAEYIKAAVENEDIRWKFSDGTKHRAGSYQSWENNVRYLQYFLNKRLQYISELWGIKNVGFDWKSTNEVHKVTLMIDGNVSDVIEVLDGERLMNLPKTEDDWRFSYSGEKYINVLPILEDCTLVLQ